MTPEHQRTIRRSRGCQCHRGTEFEPYVCGRKPVVQIEDGRYVCKRCRAEIKAGAPRPDHRTEEQKRREELP
jgi:ribosomal protein L37AE/L43A